MRRVAVSSLALTLLAATAVGAAPRDSIALMTAAAESFVASLDADQRPLAVYGLDADERENVRLTPFAIAGLRFDAMRPGQLSLVHALLSAGLSATGYHKVASIIALEEHLVEIEMQQRGRRSPVHGTENYSVAIFGTPRQGGTWTWRLHGHHLYLTVTIVLGMAFATSPAFLGAEPHRVTTGPRAGWWILRDEETLGRDLAAALSAAELAEATLAGELPNDVFSASNRTLDAMREAPGVAYADLSEPARARLRDLVLEYVSNSAEDLQTERLLRVERGGWEAVRFGWIAGNGERIYYRVQGPEFLIEYCAVSLSPNHVHTVWRDFDGDFGRDILAEHMNGSAH